jgi:arsenite oxidase small subunit
MSPREASGPLWKDEFSVHSADERYVARRQFTKFLVLTSLAMFVGQLWILVKSWFARTAPAPPIKVIAQQNELKIGHVKLFTYPTAEDHCIMIRTAPDRYVAYSQKCTHLSCAVYYSKERNRLECPCHNGFFSVEDGSVLAGPPPRPLPKIVLEARGDELVATGVREA